MGSNKQSKLIKSIGRAPNPGWVNSYFNLVDSMLSETSLTSDDPRLVMSLPAKRTLPVTVNNRYVLHPFRKEQSRTEFILPANQGSVNKYLKEADRKGRFDAIYNEDESQRPWFVGFDGNPERIVDNEFKRLWLSAVEREIKRAKKSPYRRYHEPIVYKTAKDQDYRERVIREAFK